MKYRKKTFKQIKILLVLIPILCYSVQAVTKKNITQTLKKVISQEKYIYYQPEAQSAVNHQDSWFAKLADKIFLLIQKLFRLSVIPSVLLYILILVLIGYLVFKLIHFFLHNREINIAKPNQLQDTHYSLDYIKELKYALELFQKGEFKKSLSAAIKSLWLFYHSRDILLFHHSITNREYLQLLREYKQYPEIKNIVIHAEQLVYAKDVINKNECQKIFQQINSIIT